MLNIVVLHAINQVCKSTPAAAGSRSACDRAIGSIVSGHADVAGDPEEGPGDGAGSEEGQEGLHQERARPFRVPAVDEASADVGTFS